MRIIVISDSHSDYSSIETVLIKHPDISNIIFLGDGLRDIDRVFEKYPDRRFLCVSGNCDFDINTPNTRLEEFGSRKFLITHGHAFSVKSGLLNISLAGKERGCDAVLFGHTHTPTIDLFEGMYLINPGSVGGKNTDRKTYAIIDITDKGLVPNIIEV